ncbi:hypothetical protein SAMN05421505_12022 [Sinosporangium album]|uniref:Uncharacterized protein n=1 Tax=Sinosporangium album TaxID=504805 RepID=A0A1G8EBR1_9ACTN|nr:hypothetical protein [Sinosporangium album]SDH67149.1 hypothetical protein SAMN05421505_12022 [Sinosporangium album]
MADWPVIPERVAARAGLPLPLAPAQRAAIEEAVTDALAQAAAELGKLPTPETITETGVRPGPRGGWQLSYDPVIAVESAAPESGQDGHPTGLYTVTYRAGLDPATDRVYGQALSRFVAAAAAASPMVRRLAQNVPGARLVRQVNVEGQGITYEDTPTSSSGSGGAGAAPTVDSLKRWKRRGAYQQPGIAPHPMEGWWLREEPWR